MPLQQPCIYQGDNLLYHGILPTLGRVVMLLQVGFEYLGDSVVETRREPSPEIAEQLVRRATGLPVNQFNQYLALRIIGVYFTTISFSIEAMNFSLSRGDFILSSSVSSVRIYCLASMA